MGLAALATIFAVGLAVGLLSGLIGLGGGVLIVPFLYFFYAHPELSGLTLDPELRTVLAHGTSLFVIVPTSIRGVLAYRRAGLVEWRVVWPVGVASVLAAVAGAQIALLLPAAALKAAFGVLLIVSGIRLAWRRAEPPPGEAHPGPRLALPLLLGIGLTVGVFSAVLGVGGGAVAIPLLVHLVHLDMRKVAATSIGIIVLSATAGTLAYMLSGREVVGLPPGHVGYVHVTAGIVMFLGAVLTVGWGARLNQRLHPRRLTLLFATVFVLLGLRLAAANLPPLLSASLG